MGRVVIEGRNPLDGTIINQLKLIVMRKNKDNLADMIIDDIIFQAGSIDNLITLKQNWETESEYEERIYTKAHSLFMDTAEDLGFTELDDDDNARYDGIREDAIEDISRLLKGLI
jgi:hypothetical protein